MAGDTCPHTFSWGLVVRQPGETGLNNRDNNVRYPHYVRPCGGGKWPSKIVIVDGEGRYSDVQGRNRSQLEKLTNWTMIELVRAGETYQYVRQVAGYHAPDFWRSLRALADANIRLWLLSFRCTRVWSMLNFWEEIEDGRIHIGMGDYRDGRADNAAHGRSQAGFLVLEDPPNIAAFTYRDCPAQISWVDSRNYGVECGGDLRTAADRVRYLSGWTVAAASALVKYRLGALAYTAGSQAMRGWRHSYLTHGVYAHAHKEGTRLEGSAYFGGRCECFHIGVVPPPVWHLDFRSLYPSVCVNAQVPTRLIRVYPDGGGSGSICQNNGIGTIATVSLDSDEPAYPTKKDGYIIYPVGRFITTLAGPELMDALARGRVKRLHRLAEYEMDYALRDYASAVYALRLEAEAVGTAALSGFAKRLLVCLPGKLAQRVSQFQLYPGLPSDVQYGEWIGTDRNGMPTRFRSVAGVCLREIDMGWSEDSNIAVAAWITSAGRMILLNAIRAAGWCNVYYVDTDSLMVNEAGYELLQLSGLVSEDTLGTLTVRSAGVSAEIIGIKHYLSQGRRTCSGLPRGYSSPTETGSQYWYSQFASQSVRHGRKPQAERVLRRYVRSSPYHHGEVHADGRVTPIVLEEW